MAGSVEIRLDESGGRINSSAARQVVQNYLPVRKILEGQRGCETSKADLSNCDDITA